MIADELKAMIHQKQVTLTVNDIRLVQKIAQRINS